jgi:hypothetical protein
MGINRFALLIGNAARIALIAGFSFSSYANAQTSQTTADQRAACTPDAFRLCSAEIPDVTRVAACMAANEASLSPGCRAVFQTFSAADPATAPPQPPRRTHRNFSTSARYRDPHALSHYAHRETSASRHRAWARS